MLSTALTTSWGLGQPVIQAPMAGVSGGGLAAAVSAAGGLGMIGVSNATSVEWLVAQAAIARGQGRFGIGLLAWDIDIRTEVLEVALEQRPF
ncbi:MAG TPA: nitronate monooxygenase, partial [Chloroflexota bacterium]|nr:nitronate monooxygenase [Chloroflexota bacterium]